MYRRLFISLLCPIVLFFITLNSGCSTTKPIVTLIKKEKPYLKKKIMVFPPVDLSGLPAGKAAQISDSLVELLKASPRLLFYTPDELFPEYLDMPSEVKATKFGVAYYNPDLSKMAKDKNMNALIAAYLPPIEINKGRAGIWPFRYDTDIYKISMIINVMDITNGCLYLTKLDSEEIAISSKKVKGLKENEALNEALTEAIPDILERQASAVIESLNEEPWTGRILDVSKGVLKINAGKDVGINQDQLFTVYEQGGSIVCRTGRTVDLLGNKVGKIKTVSIMDQYSLAAPETGGPFLTGQTIIFIPN